MSDPLLDLLATPPAPSMTVDEDAIHRGGRRRVRHQRATRGVVAAVVACGLGGVAWAAAPRAQVINPAATPPSHTATVSPLERQVARIASSSTAVALQLADGARVWIDPGDMSKRGQMRVAARSAAGTVLGVGAKATTPVGEPYNVTLDWSRTLMSDRLLVWGVGLEGDNNFRPDLATGMRVVSVKTALVPKTHVIVYALDVRASNGTAPESVNAVTGLQMQSPVTWPPKG
jgi:hypothetical protein